MKRIVSILFCTICIIACKSNKYHQTDTADTLYTSQNDSIKRAQVLEQITSPAIQLSPELQEKMIINKN